MSTQHASEWTSRAEALLSPLYAQPDRAYHGLKHIQALLTLLDAHQHLVHDLLAVTLAIWFHDAIYDSTRKDNEAQSAVLAERTLSEWGVRCAFDRIGGKQDQGNAAPRVDGWRRRHSCVPGF